MTNPATPIFPTTWSGSRRPVACLNQACRKGKAEPSRSNRQQPPVDGSSTSPDQYGTPSVPVESEASSLLVILHYLLKNNTTFMTGDGADSQYLPRGAVRAKGDTMGSPPHPREVGG